MSNTINAIAEGLVGLIALAILLGGIKLIGSLFSKHSNKTKKE